MKLNIRKLFLSGFAVLLIGGCQNATVLKPNACDCVQVRDVITPAEKKLNYGVLSFEEGNYQASTVALQGVLESSVSSKPEKVKAYKYLAFIQCVSGHESICRDYFKKALEIDSNFNLDTAEAGHPIWGPVFRSVKSKTAK